MLTISEIAGFAGVTVRAVRHYHARGLLPEPARDSSGYRRYDAQAVVDLIRIKALADAGVPLARVRELLRAEPEQFAYALADIDRSLRAEIRRLQAHRSRVAQLVSGDGLALPPQVVDYLHRLDKLGLSERFIRMERDGWMLIAARHPDEVHESIRQKAELLDDAAYRDLYLAFDQSFGWHPHDPRLADLADTLAAYLARMTPDEERAAVESAKKDLDEPLVTLLDSHSIQASPAWKRLSELLQESGWTGWTKISRSEESQWSPD